MSSTRSSRKPTARKGSSRKTSRKGNHHGGYHPPGDPQGNYGARKTNGSTFKLNMRLENAAFRDDEDEDTLNRFGVSDTLDRVADRLHEEDMDGPVMDMNGNTVGRYGTRGVKALDKGRTLKMSVRMGNAAMQTTHDVEGVVRAASRKIRDGYSHDTIMDTNGNTVGTWKITGISKSDSRKKSGRKGNSASGTRKANVGHAGGAAAPKGERPRKVQGVYGPLVVPHARRYVLANERPRSSVGQGHYRRPAKVIMVHLADGLQEANKVETTWKKLNDRTHVRVVAEFRPTKGAKYLVYDQRSILLSPADETEERKPNGYVSGNETSASAEARELYTWAMDNGSMKKAIREAKGWLNGFKTYDKKRAEMKMGFVAKRIARGYKAEYGSDEFTVATLNALRDQLVYDFEHNR